jgi:hypothetical protein
MRTGTSGPGRAMLLRARVAALELRDLFAATWAIRRIVLDTTGLIAVRWYKDP